MYSIVLYVYIVKVIKRRLAKTAIPNAQAAVFPPVFDPEASAQNGHRRWSATPSSHFQLESLTLESTGASPDWSKPMARQLHHPPSQGFPEPIAFGEGELRIMIIGWHNDPFGNLNIHWEYAIASSVEWYAIHTPKT